MFGIVDQDWHSGLMVMAVCVAIPFVLRRVVMAFVSSAFRSKGVVSLDGMFIIGILLLGLQSFDLGLADLRSNYRQISTVQIVSPQAASRRISSSMRAVGRIFGSLPIAR